MRTVILQYRPPAPPTRHIAAVPTLCTCTHLPASLLPSLSRPAQVGDISVVRFGTEVKEELKLGTPWTNGVAARVISSFRFKDDTTQGAVTTQLVGALELTQEIFEHSRGGGGGGGGGAGQLLQLAFFISDGQIQSKEERARVRALARDYASKNVLLVLLILDKDAKADVVSKGPLGGAAAAGGGGAADDADDAGDAGGGAGAAAPAAAVAPVAARKATQKSSAEHNEVHSILDIKQFSFVGGKVQFTSYMDDYPFPYYIIVRNMNALPEVLADALRQWFEMVQAK